MNNHSSPKQALLEAIDADRLTLSTFLSHFLDIKDAPGTTTASATAIRDHLAKTHIRSVAIAPPAPGAPASITSLINQCVDGPSLVMSALLPVSATGPGPGPSPGPAGWAHSTRLVDGGERSEEHPTFVRPGLLAPYATPQSFDGIGRGSHDLANSDGGMDGEMDGGMNGEMDEDDDNDKDDDGDDDDATVQRISTAALTAAYAYLHRFQAHLAGSLTFIAVSDTRESRYGALRYMLHEDDRRGLFIADAVLDGSSSATAAAAGGDGDGDDSDPGAAVAGKAVRNGRSVVDGAGYGAGKVLEEAVARNVGDVFEGWEDWMDWGEEGRRSSKESRYADEWRRMGVPVCSFGVGGSNGHDRKLGGEVDVEEFVGLVKVMALAGWDYLTSEDCPD